MTSDFRAGFVSFVGRPNVGKSTLTNALVGQKIAITSPKPQTTRRAIRGIVHRQSGQLIIVDTPGIHRPRKLLGKRLNALVESTLGEVDVIAQCFPAGEKIGPGDKFIYDQVQRFTQAKKIAIITKIDETNPNTVIERLAEVDALGDWEAVIPTSAVAGTQVDELADLLIEQMPLSPQLYEETHLTDESQDDRIAELIREAAIYGAREELPHSLAATVDDYEEDDDTGKLRIYASLIVERDSQKGIVIGRGGQQLKNIGQAARKQIEQLLGRKVYLSLRVKVLKEWQSDPKHLNRLGF
ncbi:GTPase Era [Canibacter zhoujuaniae]|uniref:GTPase Era n=1 Tax=Canibacter zhoujuaniae TaxID=2708343 RepID=UPI0014203585|nr:GTPase Era [Canibacter zhoujuaniae]